MRTWDSDRLARPHGLLHTIRIGRLNPYENRNGGSATFSVEGNSGGHERTHTYWDDHDVGLRSTGSGESMINLEKDRRVPLDYAPRSCLIARP